MRSLVIGIDGRAFHSPAPGIRRYVTGLTSALRDLDEGFEIVALGGAADGHLPEGIGRIAEPLHPPTNLGWTLVGLPRAASRAGVDLIHAPSYTAPFLAPVPVVLTIHDVSYARHPEWYPYRRDWLRRRFYRRSARSASHVITVSEFSAGEIVAAYGIPRSRITVAPNGAAAAFSADASGLESEVPAEVRRPFLLHVGDLHERRNVAVVVEALIQARHHFGMMPGLSLVLAGTDRGVGDHLCALAAAADAPEAVVRLGPVDEGLLHALYRGASALVYPSLYEGFGLPVLEAMASGVPVIASRAASMPEVVGDAGILLDPADVAAWADAIARVMNDAPVRERMIARGRARAAAFTWHRAARITADVYRRLVDR